jgi:glycosyltransferase involved in cell wall biosynthesis
LLIGLLATDPGQLRSLPNVIFTGPKPYQSLPSWTKAFDAAIIPYRLTHHTPQANPLKLREYLASGKPVISVPNAEIRRFADHVYLADTREEFLNAVERALAEDSDARRRARMAAVAGLTWDARFHDVIRIVGRELNRKHHRNPMH